MKKLLILTLVLGLASSANAALNLVVSHNSTPEQGDYYDPVDTELVLYPSDYLWIGVYNDHDYSKGPGGNSPGLWFLGIDTTGQVHNGSWTGQWVQYKPPLVADAPPNFYAGPEEDVYGDGSLLLDLWILELASGNPEQYTGIGVLDAKEFHCDAVGDVVVHLLDDMMIITDTITIHQIPEPATIVLLGLGGLAILRKRKKRSAVSTTISWGLERKV